MEEFKYVHSDLCEHMYFSSIILLESTLQLRTNHLFLRNRAPKWITSNSREIFKNFQCTFYPEPISFI